MAVRLPWRDGFSSPSCGAVISSLFLFLATYHLISHRQHYPVRAPAWDEAYHHLANDGFARRRYNVRRFDSPIVRIQSIPRIRYLDIRVLWLSLSRQFLSNFIDDQRNNSRGTHIISIILGIYPMFLPSCLSFSEKYERRKNYGVTDNEAAIYATRFTRVKI